MKKAFYHQAGKEPKLLNIIRQHEDGTVDLGNGIDNLVVAKCAVVAKPVVGCCTLADGVVPESVVVPEASKLLKSLEGATAEIEKLRGELKESRTANETLKGEVARLTADNGKLAKENKSLSDDGTKHLKELESLKAEVAKHKVEIEKAQAEVAKLKGAATEKTVNAEKAKQ